MVVLYQEVFQRMCRFLSCSLFIIVVLFIELFSGIIQAANSGSSRLDV